MTIKSHKYSPISLERLDSCHRDLQILFNRVLIGYDHSILCGHRGEIDQNTAFKNGYSKLKFPDSKHNSDPSMAVDALPYETNHIDSGKTQTAFFAGYVKATADQLFEMGTIHHKIRCGVDWDSDMDIDDTTFWDGGHFELIPNEFDD